MELLKVLIEATRQLPTLATHIRIESAAGSLVLGLLLAGFLLGFCFRRPLLGALPAIVFFILSFS
ncbi:MAG: hypothetical protein HYU64_01420 [Armatimonadetes bacterium]|nr:hypothetical protein [Armatimonadota bacterium]